MSVCPTRSGFGEASRPRARSANGGFTCDTTVTLLFEGSKSWLLEVTLALEEMRPAVVGATTTVATATAPAGILPRVAVTTPPALPIEPCETLAETKTTDGGSTWLMTVLLAVSGPALVTRIVYTRLLPTNTGSGDAVIPMERSTPGH